MSKNNIIELDGLATISDPLTDYLKNCAQSLLHVALENEVQELLSNYQDRRLPNGRAAVVRNGHQPERDIQTSLGPVKVSIPKVRSKDGEPVNFHSVLVPPYVRRTRTLESAIPWLYLKGVSSGEMRSALEVLVGSQARGLSASTVSRLKREWAAEYDVWRQKPLDKERWVYVWADGIHSGLRGGEGKLCASVVIGVDELGVKHLLALEDGIRESTQSWREVLLNLKARGMNAPKLAIGDGAMGFWGAFDS